MGWIRCRRPGRQRRELLRGRLGNCRPYAYYDTCSEIVTLGVFGPEDGCVAPLGRVLDTGVIKKDADAKTEALAACPALETCA